MGSWSVARGPWRPSGATGQRLEPISSHFSCQPEHSPALVTADSSRELSMTAHPNRTRRILILLAKLALAAAILAYLFVQVHRQEGFARLVDEPKRWWLLAAALATTFAAVTLSFVRWHVLVAALGLEHRLLQTVRLGALGFVLNFVSLGGLGGDLFKAIFLAKDFPGRRTEAVATVVADRLLGLLGMFALATTATLLVDWSAAPTAVIVLIQLIRLVGVASFAVAGLVLVVPALSGEQLRNWVGKLPLVGSTGARLIGAVSAYRNQKTPSAAGRRAVPGGRLAVHPVVLSRGPRTAGPCADAGPTLRHRASRDAGRGDPRHAQRTRRDGGGGQRALPGRSVAGRDSARRRHAGGPGPTRDDDPGRRGLPRVLPVAPRGPARSDPRNGRSCRRGRRDLISYVRLSSLTN